MSLGQNHLESFIRHRLLSPTSRGFDLVVPELGLRIWTSNSFLSDPLIWDNTVETTGLSKWSEVSCQVSWKTFLWTGIHLYNSCLAVALCYIQYSTSVLKFKKSLIFKKKKTIHFQFTGPEFVLAYCWRKHTKNVVKASQKRRNKFFWLLIMLLHFK